MSARRIAFAALLSCCGESGARSAPAAEDVRVEVRRVDPPAEPGSIALSPRSAGAEIVATWIEPHGEAQRVRFATLDRELRWSTPSTVAESDVLLANWADFPMPLRTASGAHYVTFALRGRERYASFIQLAVSRDGRDWTRASPLHDDTTETEHGFVSLLEEGDGVRAVWLDGRATADGGPMALRTARIDAAGAIADSEVLDERVCDCCQTTAARTGGGALVAYRDRSDAEVRDVAAVRGTTARWTPPAPVHADRWTMPGCPVNGPQAAADGDRVALVWYTEAAGPRVQIAFSDDAGARFGDPIDVDAAGPLGRVDVEWASADDVIVSWLAGAEAHASLRLRRIARDGRQGAPIEVAQVGVARASGFPRLARIGRRVLVSWTDVGPPTRVRAAVVELADVPPPTARAAPAPERRDPMNVGARLPEITLNDLSGGAVPLATLRGKPIVIAFFAAWCQPCRAEYPLLTRIAREHGDRVHVVGVSIDDGSADDVRAFARTNGLEYRVLHDRDDASAQAFGVPPIPASFVFDAQGVLTYRRVGGGAELERELPDAVRATLR